MTGRYTVELSSPAPWGFRLQGGKDFNMPIIISRVVENGKAAKAGVAVGDVLISIGDISTETLNNLEAQSKIKECPGNLLLTLQRAATVPRPDVEPKVTAAVSKVMKQIRKPITEMDIGFYHVGSHVDASRKRIMEDTEDWRPRTGTSQSRSFHILAQITGTHALLNKPEQVNETVTVKQMKVREGPQYHKLRDWHHGVSARTLNVFSLV